jgi:type IV fimbrial biogenesis protein FimT
MRHHSGFTVVELVTMIAVVAVLTAVAVPNFLQFLPNYRLKSAIRDLYSNLQLIKLEAIKSNGKCSIKYYTNPDRYTVMNKRTVVLEDYGSGINFDGPANQTFAVATITFNSRGTCNSGYAYLSNSERSAFYRVSPLSSGVVKLRKWVEGSWQ